MEDHYVAWRQTHDQPQHNFGSDGPFSFCSYPYLLSPRAKSKLLHTEARFLMTQVSICLGTPDSASKHERVALRCAGLVSGKSGLEVSCEAPPRWHPVPACLAAVRYLTVSVARCMVLHTLCRAILR